MQTPSREADDNPTENCDHDSAGGFAKRFIDP